VIDDRAPYFLMPDYATQHYGPRGPKTSASGGGVDVRTLFLTASASAAAAYTCSKIWAPGTLASAAFTPVLVSLIKEALARPTAVVARAVPVRGVVRGARPQGPQPFDAGGPGAPGDAAQSASQPPGSEYVSPEARVAQPGEIQYHDSKRRGRGWRVAIVTGLLGFLVCAAVFTVPELISGVSAAGGDRVTTIFGGQHHSRPAPAVTTTTTTPTQTVTAPPTTTVTVPAPAATTTTPTPTTTTPQPAVPTTTAPTTTTPPPPETQPPVVPPPGG
jgi:hypothetical protein